VQIILADANKMLNAWQIGGRQTLAERRQCDRSEQRCHAKSSERW
jgi:hypothetical protein